MSGCRVARRRRTPCCWGRMARRRRTPCCWGRSATEHLLCGDWSDGCQLARASVRTAAGAARRRQANGRT